MNREEAINRFKGIRQSFSISIAQSKFYPSKVILDELCDMAIEALSAEVKSLGASTDGVKGELISRANVLEGLKHSTAYLHDDIYTIVNRIPSAETTGALDDAIAKYVADGLMELPSAEVEWIPCSERLPSEDGRYLVTYPLLRWQNNWISVMHYGKPLDPTQDVKGKCFYYSDSEWGDVVYDNILAWMPLPKPYKKENEVKE